MRTMVVRPCIAVLDLAEVESVAGVVMRIAGNKDAEEQCWGRLVAATVVCHK